MSCSGRTLNPRYHLNSDLRSALCQYGTSCHDIRYCFPFNGGNSVGAYSARPFGPQLRGYFHASVMKICTGHLLSVFQERMYSSPSTPFCLCSVLFLIMIYDASVAVNMLLTERTHHRPLLLKKSLYSMSSFSMWFVTQSDMNSASLSIVSFCLSSISCFSSSNFSIFFVRKKCWNLWGS